MFNKLNNKIFTVLTTISLLLAESAVANSIQEPFNPKEDFQTKTELTAQNFAKSQGVQIDWGPMGLDFHIISQPQIEVVQQRDAFGQIQEVSVITFLVEAKNFFTPLGYFGYFYDERGIQVGPPIPIDFDPQKISFQRGERTEVQVLLVVSPEEWQNVRRVKFTRL